MLISNRESMSFENCRWTSSRDDWRLISWLIFAILYNLKNNKSWIDGICHKFMIFKNNSYHEIELFEFESVKLFFDQRYIPPDSWFDLWALQSFFITYSGCDIDWRLILFRFFSFIFIYLSFSFFDDLYSLDFLEFVELVKKYWHMLRIFKKASPR